MNLTEEELSTAQGRHGDGQAMAMRIVADAGRLLGADRLVPIASAHIDGCLYHGDAGVVFAERLALSGARVRVPATLNVGSIDRLRPDLVRLDARRRAMAERLMLAHERMGCTPTWTCSPYQAGHRPDRGSDVAWGESNAVTFCNSVLGARTNRYGDFLDIVCAIVGRAPRYGLHVPENRLATIVIDAGALSSTLRGLDAFWPVLGAWLGRTVGEDVPVLTGLSAFATEDRLKALGAAAASFGGVGLFHVAGFTPEAPTTAAALGRRPAHRTIALTAAMIRDARQWLSTATGSQVDAVAVGSPHLSFEEVTAILAALRGRRATTPFYAHTGDHVVERLHRQGFGAALDDAGITLVVGTCIVVTPILPPDGGVLLTNSGKFAALRARQHRLGRPVRQPSRLRRKRGGRPAGPGRDGMVVTAARILYPGEAAGPLLRLSAPLSFWGGIDPETGTITDVRHPQHGYTVGSTVLALPRPIGSSSSASVMLEMIRNGSAPAGLILGKGGRHPRRRMPGGAGNRPAAATGSGSGRG